MGQSFNYPTPEQQLWASAAEVARLQGDDACRYASSRVECLQAEGNHDGAIIWRAILSRLQDLGPEPSMMPSA